LKHPIIQNNCIIDLPLEHAATCPCRHYAHATYTSSATHIDEHHQQYEEKQILQSLMCSNPLPSIDKCIRVAVVVLPILSMNTGRWLLMTRRPKHMRAFPQAW
jgi:hypothetical protein